jgi:tetratricopeptide (TPR) repeat protein
MVKEGNEWKILAQLTTAPDSYDATNPQILEGDLNAAGYNLITANRLADAIEVFKLNVKLFPEAWNTYDSLAEAYALTGDKKKAIENYEKSIKLNPKSESGPPALQKLKGK